MGFESLFKKVTSALYGATAAVMPPELNLVGTLIGKQLELLPPLLTNWRTVMTAAFTHGIPAMLGFGPQNMAAFLAFQVAVLQFFIPMILIAASPTMVQDMYRKYVVAPLKGLSAKLAAEDDVTRDVGHPWREELTVPRA